MAVTVRTRTWYLYEYPTDMGCASGPVCPLGGRHALYGGMSNLPALRDRQHERTAAWWLHRSGPMQILPGVYGSEDECRAAEALMIASGRYLANIDGNEANPCRWYFGPPRGAAPRRTRVARRRRGRGFGWRLLRRRRRKGSPMVRRAVYALLLFSLIMVVYHNPGHAADLVKGLAGAVSTFIIHLTS